MEQNIENTSKDTNEQQTDLEDLAKIEITKATISEAVGTFLFPLTKQIAIAEEKGIQYIIRLIKSKNKEKFVEKNKTKIDEIIKENKFDSEKLKIIEKLYFAINSASSKELENDELMELWSKIIDKIQEGDVDTDLLISKLESLTTAEAKFLINFHLGKYKFININSFLSMISFQGKLQDNYERNQELALSLKNKGLLIQPFPVFRAIFGMLFPILFFLLFAELYRDFFERLSINVSSANNVILMGVLGVMLGLSLIPFLKQKTRLTWIGKKLCDGIKI